MTYEMYRYLSLGAAIACAIMVVVSVVLFFMLQIPKVIGDLTGRTARKAIEDIRKQNEQSGDKVYRSSSVNLRRGKLTDKITHSGRIETKHTTPFGTGAITEKISTQRLPGTEVSSETVVLNEGNETTVLSQIPESAPVPSICTETTVLQQREEENDSSFVIEYEITFIHTNEVIS